MITVAADIGNATYESSAFFPGTIWSVQPAHPVYGISGVPTNGMTVPNVAWRNFNRLTGRNATTQQTDSYGTFVINGGGGAKMSITRSNKGGVEILPSQTSADNNTGGFFYAPDPVKQYVLDNSSNGSNSADHEFAMLMWFVGVRAVKTGANQDRQFFGGVLHNSANSMFAIIGTAGTTAGAFSSLPDHGVYSYPSVFPLNTPTLRASSGRSWVAKPLIANMTVCAGFGNPPPRAFASDQNYSAGGVFYRADLIDLTASGLTLDDTGLVHAPPLYLDYEQVRLPHRRSLDFAVGSRGPFFGDNIPVAAASFP
jgi:hypothetical protein